MTGQKRPHNVDGWVEIDRTDRGRGGEGWANRVRDSKDMGGEVGETG